MDQRILLLCDLLKEEGRIKYKREFFDILGVRRQNVNNIKQGTQHFTAEQIEIVCNKFNVNANWIYGFSTQVMREISPIEMPEVKHKFATKRHRRSISGHPRIENQPIRK